MWIAKGKRVSTFPDVWMLQCCHNFLSVLVVAVNLSVLEITDLSSQLHQHCSHYCLSCGDCECVSIKHGSFMASPGKTLKQNTLKKTNVALELKQNMILNHKCIQAHGMLNMCLYFMAQSISAIVAKAKWSLTRSPRNWTSKVNMCKMDTVYKQDANE